MEYCTNCQKSIASEKFDLHIGYCRRNIVQCNLCKQPYDRNMQEQHEEEFHSKKQCPHCSNQFQTSLYDNHLNSCVNKPLHCQYCELNIPKQLYQQHLKQCESRTKFCQLCHRDIQNKYYFSHISQCVGFRENYQKIENQDGASFQSNFYSQSVNSRFMNPATRVRYQRMDNNVQNIHREIDPLARGQSSINSSHTSTTAYPYTDTTRHTSQTYTASYTNNRSLPDFHNNLYDTTTKSQYGQNSYQQSRISNAFSDEDPQLQRALMESMGLIHSETKKTSKY